MMVQSQRQANWRGAREGIVVCDIGSGSVKCGFAGDTFPRAVVPCVVGRQSLRHELPNLHRGAKTDAFVGDIVLQNRSYLDVSYPVKNGNVHNWDDLYLVWDHIFHEQLKVEPRDSSVLLTDAALNPSAVREKMLQVMFERYGFSTACIQIQAVLTLYAQGLLTGLVVDSGDSVSYAVPVISGFAMTNLTKRLDVAGRHVTQHLLELLQARGYPLDRTADFIAVQELKEKLCYVACDYEREIKLARETTHLMKSYTLPDGQQIHLGPERFMASEMLFNPTLADVEAPGLSEMAYTCIQDVDTDNRMALLQHIVITGGSSMFPGLPTRMEKDIRQLYNSRTLRGNRAGINKLRLCVIDPPNRKHMVFLGGAVLADIMKDHQDFWITKQQWEEDPHGALKRCGFANNR